MSVLRALALILTYAALTVGGRKFRDDVLFEVEVGRLVIAARKSGIPMSQIEVFL